MRLPPWLGLIAFGIVAACSDGRGVATVTLEMRGADSPDDLEHGPTLESAHHLIRIRRELTIPADCGPLAGEIARAASELTLRVAPRPDRRSCVGEDTLVAYTATIAGLRPGRYNLRVVHAPAGTAPHVVFDHPVMVTRPARSTID